MRLSNFDKSQIKLDITLSSILCFLCLVGYIICLYALGVPELANVCLFVSGYYFGQVILLLRIYYNKYIK